MYNKVDTNLNFMEREKNVEQFWRDNDILKEYGTAQAGSDLHIL